MPREAEEEDAARRRAAKDAIEQLTGLFKADPSVFMTERELCSQLSRLLSINRLFTLEASPSSSSLVHEEYPTPFNCQMGDLRFEVLEDSARARRGHYDLVILNPWWLDNASSEALSNDNFALFRREFRDKAQPGDPPLCLVGIEMHLVSAERASLADYSHIQQDYRKLLFSGSLANGWRFMAHRYMLVYSQHSQPHEAKWRELVQAAWEPDVDPRNVWLAWTSPQGTRWSS